MKKLIALLLTIASLISLAGCKDDKYPEIKSSKEEETVMMTLKIEKEKYEIKYELYRALFLNYKEEYDGGNSSFWQSEAASSAIQSINERILSFTADIFAVLHVAKKIGFNPYGAEADELVYSYVAESVEGSDEVKGFGGDYEAYLASLKKANLNYSVQTLLYRYAIAYDKILTHYRGTEDSENPTLDMQSGALKYTKDDVLAFYNSEDSVRVSIIVLNALYKTEADAEKIRETVAACTTRTEALNKAIASTISDPADILGGAVIGKNSFDTAYYSEVTDVAFKLSPDETSRVIDVVTATKNEYWILYGLEKDTEHFEEYYDIIKESYISEEIGKIINTAKNTLISSKTESEAFTSLNHSEISMD